MASEDGENTSSFKRQRKRDGIPVQTAGHHEGALRTVVHGTALAGLNHARLDFTPAKSLSDPVQAGAREAESAEEAEESWCNSRSGGGHAGDHRG